MDSSDNRLHHTAKTRTTTSGDFGICFASRFSSSSMKSILSPARSDKFRDISSSSAPLSLPSSLSRRLRNNGSIKGGQASPMFPAGGKKRGCAFENPEPSSPKVTCIGQVRVKSKKKQKQRQNQLQMQRSYSMRRSGDVSFRKSEKWVHLPVTICEALREFTCFFPCRSSESKSTTEKSRSDSCGRALVKWLVTLQEKEGERGREIQVVIGEEEEDKVEEMRSLSKWRRGRLGDIWDCEKGEIVEEGSDWSVSVPPPKNALLLMRCGSDPLKMSALANRLWKSSALRDTGDESEKEDYEVGDEKSGKLQELEYGVPENRNYENSEEIMEEDFENQLNPDQNFDISEVHEELAGIEEQEAENSPVKEVEEEPTAPDQDSKTLEENEGDSKKGQFELCCDEIDPSSIFSIHSEVKEGQCEEQSPEDEKGEEDFNPETLGGGGEREREGIAESLLLQMMFEPKISMEVSKETWVCPGDFKQRRRRARPAMPINGPYDSKKSPADTRPPVPARWSCSLPFTDTASSRARASVSNSLTVIGGEKVVPCERFELTRCKSEPVRTDSGKTAAAGVGF